MATSAPRSPPPTPALLAALSARYGSAADVEATRTSFLAMLSRGRAVSPSPSPLPMHGRLLKVPSLAVPQLASLSAYGWLSRLLAAVLRL